MKTSIQVTDVRSTKRALNFLLNYAKLEGITLEALAKKIHQTPAYIYNLRRKKDLVFEEILDLAEGLGLEATITFKNKE